VLIRNNRGIFLTLSCNETKIRFFFVVELNSIPRRQKGVCCTDQNCREPKAWAYSSKTQQKWEENPSRNSFFEPIYSSR